MTDPGPYADHDPLSHDEQVEVMRPCDLKCPRCGQSLDGELYGPCNKCVEILKARAEERGAIIRKKLEERKARGDQGDADLETLEDGGVDLSPI